MLVAVQGCSHGSLTAIYDSIAAFEQAKGQNVDLLLLCGDFQALRSRHDFASLSVPVKYQSLGTFHEYYSGARVAPVLTIVIGGNHEASNYMWELYYGGWLAPSIYYLGCAGSVIVNGVRISGASGIFKHHDYRKGHYEQVPFDRSTLRSVYHIREYDVAKLQQLPRAEPTIFMSHDWPITIAHHGNMGALLKRKPFFKDEINKNTLGSPPLLELLRHLQPQYWFSAHLHVKFAALYEHPADAPGAPPIQKVTQALGAVSLQDKPAAPAAAANPDEIQLSDDEDDAAPASAVANPDEIALSDDEDDVAAPTRAPVANPDEITLSDDEDAVEAVAGSAEAPPAPSAPAAVAPAANGASNPDEIMLDDDEEPCAVDAATATAAAVAAAAAPLASSVQETVTIGESSAGGRSTRFLALDKCGPGKDFIQFLDIPSPDSPPQARITFDPHWLAITRALNPYLSTGQHQPPLPEPPIVAAMIEDELARIRDEGLLVPGELTPAEIEAGAAPPLVWEKGPIDIGRVQQFWPTAPPEGFPGGGKDLSYSNPQTEVFCGMLGIENKINVAQQPRQ